MAYKTIIDFGENVHPVIWQRLTKIAQSGQVSNGYIFSGPSGVGKEGVALSFAALLNCKQPEDGACGHCDACARFKTLQHEHLHLVFPLPRGKTSTNANNDPFQDLDTDAVNGIHASIAKKTADPFHKIMVPKANRIRIQSIRHLRQVLYMKMVEKGRRVVVIFDAQLLSAGQGEAANSLLKLLEEPPDRTTFVLITDNRSELLPTILSRCQHIHFPSLDESILESLIPDAPGEMGRKTVALLAGGNVNFGRRLSHLGVTELREFVAIIIDNLIAPDPKGHRQFVREMTKLAGSDLNEFDFRISVAETWFGLLAKWKTGTLQSGLEPKLQKVLEVTDEKYPVANFVEIMNELEKVKHSPRQNLNLALAFTAATIRIQHFLHGATRFSLQHESMAKFTE